LGIEGENTLLVTEERNPIVILSARNLPYVVGVVEAKDLNTYDVLSAKYVVMTKKAVEIVEDRLKEGDEE